MGFIDLYGPGIPIASDMKQPEKQQKLAMLASEALEIVNKIRTVLLIGEGKLESLPMGYLRDAHSCVLALALSNGWRSQVGEYIYLVHAPDGSVNFNMLRVALEERGFRGVSHLTQETGWNDELEQYNPPGEVCGVKFNCPTVLEQFFTKFDSGQYPNLILNDVDAPEGNAERARYVKEYGDIVNNHDDD